MELLKISEVAKILGYHDLRSVKKWCKINGVGIITQFGSKSQFVIKDEFEAARMKPVKKYISEKYGTDNISEAISSFLKFTSQYQTAISKRKQVPKNPIETGKNQVSLGKEGEKFKQDLIEFLKFI